MSEILTNNITRVHNTRRRNEIKPVKPRTPTKKKYDDIENINSGKILCSPPKVKCRTPTSPSSMLNELKLEEPKIEPKRLFGDIKDGFKNVKKALHSSTPTQMVGRETEVTELTKFLDKHINDGSSGSVYVSGPPGTGKTATLTHILATRQFKKTYKTVYVNCTSMKSSGAIFQEIISSLSLKSKGKSEKECISCLEKYFGSAKNTTLLVLDEIDQLESKKQSVLYTLFEWPSKFTEHVVLVGIANALDLTDRILPRLQAYATLKPQLIHFAPYNKDQIVEIIKHRLTEAGVLDSFAPVAIQMLAGKVAAVSGDVRRALDIGRRAVELAEQHRKKILQPTNTNSVVQSKIEMKDVMLVLNNVYATTSNQNVIDDNAFPLQQKILLCALILLLRNGKSKNVTLGKLHDVYKKVCGKRNIVAVDQYELNSLLTLIESRGILRVSGKKDNLRMQKVCLEWNEEEVAATMQDKNLMAEILNDVGCVN